jgi:hypothetical protein
MEEKKRHREFQRGNLKQEPLGSIRHRRKDTIKIDLKRNGREWTAFIWLGMRLSGWLL